MKEKGGQLDELMKEFAELVLSDEQGVSVASPEVHSKLRFVYECMRYLTRGSGATVTYALHEPVNSMGVVTVENGSINIMDTKWFTRAVSMSSSLEVYPLINGKVRMEFGFHGLARKI